MVASGLFLVSLFALALGTPTARRAMSVHESRSEVPEGFVKQGPAPADTVLNMRLALKQNDPVGLEEAVMAVSTPGNARFGQHLTKEQVEAFVAPTKETLDAVTSFLQENGISAQTASPAGDWLSFSIPVSKANEVFDADFNVFTHQDTGSESLVTMAYSIPTDLTDHIELVHPTISFNNPLGLKPKFTVPPKLVPATTNISSDAVPASCSTTITPACLQALYGIPTTPATITSNTLGVSGYIGQFANQADLKTFLTLLRPDINPNTGFTLETLDGGSNPQGQAQAGIEADLDTQYTIGVATGVPVSFISCGEQNRDSLGGFLDQINFLLAQAAPPQVLTTSYGQNENTVSSKLANSLCNAHMQLGGRGTSILFSSGDGGVAGSQSTRCTTFLPTFPSGCSFTTSVGATSGVPETSASFSSGGFSNIFTQPSYQAGAVQAYLARLGNTNAGKFTPTGRAFPDISAQGQNVEIVFQQQTSLVAGTSCSSPIFASIIALINDRLAAQGKGPLGFLNPFLYGAAASTFTDITTGNNPGCNTNGFPAAAGWDPVTGLGTPDFTKLLLAAQAAFGL